MRGEIQQQKNFRKINNEKENALNFQKNKKKTEMPRHKTHKIEMRKR